MGGVKPTASDDVQLRATSGNVTIDAASVCRSLDLTGYVGTLTHNAFILSIGDATAGAGNAALTFPSSGWTYTLISSSGSAITFSSTSATVQTVNYGGKTAGDTVFNGVGGSWKLTGVVNLGVATLRLTKGTLDTNSQNCTWGFFESNNSNTRTLTLGASTITITQNTNAFNFTTITNLTLNANTSTIVLTGGSGQFLGGGGTYNNLTCNSGLASYTGNNTFNNFTCVGAAGTGPSFVMGGDLTVTGTLTLTGVDSGTLGGRIVMAVAIPSNGTVQRTITAASVSLTNVIFQDMIAAGTAAPFTGTLLGDAGGNSNITFDSPRTVYWVGNGGNNNLFSHYALTSGGASGAQPPLPQDTLLVDANSITSTSQTISLSAYRYYCKDLNFTGVLNNPNLSMNLSPTIIFGSLTLVSGMTTSATGGIAFNGRGSYTIDLAGVSLGNIGTMRTVTGTATLLNDFIGSGALQIDGGTFNANGFNVTVTTFNSNNTITRTINMGSGTWTLTGTGVVFNCATVTNLTFSGASATVLVTDTSATSKTFEHRQAVNKIGAVTFTGGNNANMIFGPSGYYGVLTLGANMTYLINTSGSNIRVDNLVSNGSSGNLVTIISGTAGVAAPGTPATITSSGAGLIYCDWISLQDSTATPAQTFFYGINSTIVSNVTGWNLQTRALVANRVLASGRTRANGRVLATNRTLA